MMPPCGPVLPVLMQIVAPGPYECNEQKAAFTAESRRYELMLYLDSQWRAARTCEARQHWARVMENLGMM